MFLVSLFMNRSRVGVIERFGGAGGVCRGFRFERSIGENPFELRMDNCGRKRMCCYSLI